MLVDTFCPAWLPGYVSGRWGLHKPSWPHLQGRDGISCCPWPIFQGKPFWCSSCFLPHLYQPPELTFSTGVAQAESKSQGEKTVQEPRAAAEVHPETQPWFDHGWALETLNLGIYSALSWSWLLGQVQLPLGASVCQEKTKAALF